MLKVIIRIMLKWVFWLVLPIPLKRRGGRFVTQNGVGCKSRTYDVTHADNNERIELGFCYLVDEMRMSRTGTRTSRPTTGVVGWLSERERVERGLCHITAWSVRERESRARTLSPYGMLTERESRARTLSPYGRGGREKTLRESCRFSITFRLALRRCLSRDGNLRAFVPNWTKVDLPGSA